MTISLVHAPVAPILPPANPPRPPKPKPKGEAAPQIDYRAGELAEQCHQAFDPSEPPLCCWPGTPVSLKRVSA